MKCSKCQFEQMPNNINILISHAQQELMEGNFKEVPKVIWEDTHFVLVDTVEEGKQEFKIVIYDPRPVEKFYNEELIEKEKLEARIYAAKEEAEKEEFSKIVEGYSSK
jgi:hypothetical protein